MEKNRPFDIFHAVSETDHQPTQAESTLHNTVLDELCPISTELSLSTGLRSKDKRGSTSRTHKFGASKRHRERKSNNLHPNPRNKAVEKKGSAYSSCNSKEKQWGYSTTLNLYEDPWKIKKSLTASDLGKLNRLLLGTDLVRNLMFPVLGCEAQKDAVSEKGTAIRVWDVDTMSMHQLVLKRWASFRNYVLIGTWTQQFVKRRGLKKGDEIGLHWDPYRSCFNFSVLNRAMEN